MEETQRKGRTDFRRLLERTGVEPTPVRLSVLEIVGSSASPLTAQEVFDTLSRTREVNRVTIYRILELYTEKRLLERISGGDRSFRYGMGSAADQKQHPHFFCTRCGYMECLTPECVHLNTTAFEKNFTGVVQKVEVRLDGVCKNCLRMKNKSES